MIFYVVTEGHTYTVNGFLSAWRLSVASRMEVMTYDELIARSCLPAGTYIFSDIERLTPQQTDLAAEVCDRLSGAGLRVLNHPRRSLRRYDLLRRLWSERVNRFQVYRVSETRRPDRFPVFLRRDREHGVTSKLIFTQQELDVAIEAQLADGDPPEDLLIVEFIDTADSNRIFRAHSAFVVGDRVVPWKINHDRGWLVRRHRLDGDEYKREEWTFLQTNPHEAQLRAICRLAEVGYGRVDYGFLGNQLQIWEINTNPHIVRSNPGEYSESRRPTMEYCARNLSAALEAIDQAPDPGAGFSIAITHPILGGSAGPSR